MSADLPIQMFDRPKHRAVNKNCAIAVLLRFPEDVLKKLDSIASANYRSRTAEVVLRIEASMANESIDEHGCIVVHAPAARK